MRARSDRPAGSPPVLDAWHQCRAGMVVKRFRPPVDGGERRLYGDEPRREWRPLTLLARYAPGLAPRPIRADLDADPPLIAMSQVPGEPLGTYPVTAAPEDAIAAGLSRLHHAMPPSVLEWVERAPGSPHLLPSRIRDMAHACNAELPGPMPRRAYRAALAWLGSGWAGSARKAGSERQSAARFAQGTAP